MISSRAVSIALKSRFTSSASFRTASKDGWFWGYYGWPPVKDGKPEPYVPDYPPSASNGLPAMGFGHYCLNCHTSARDNLSFASLGNIKGEHGTYLVFLEQNFYPEFPSFLYFQAIEGSGKPFPNLTKT